MADVGEMKVPWRAWTSRWLPRRFTRYPWIMLRKILACLLLAASAFFAFDSLSGNDHALAAGAETRFVTVPITLADPIAASVLRPGMVIDVIGGDDGKKELIARGAKVVEIIGAPVRGTENAQYFSESRTKGTLILVTVASSDGVTLAAAAAEHPVTFTFQ